MKVPTCNSLKACKGVMFFLPLPLSKTIDTLAEIEPSRTGNPKVLTTACKLPDPEVHITVNGEPSPSRVVWRSIVDVRGVKVAIAKLKEINWLYKEIDAGDIDDVAKKVIESVTNTGSSMLKKASKEDISGMQAYTIRTE